MSGGQLVFTIDSHEFIDSPEWFSGVTSSDTYTVTVKALEETRVMIWNRDKLKLSIGDDPYLQAIVEHVLGTDVVKKLLLLTELNNREANSGKAGSTESELSKLLTPTTGSKEKMLSSKDMMRSSGILSSNHHPKTSNGGKNHSSEHHPHHHNSHEAPPHNPVKILSDTRKHDTHS